MWLSALSIFNLGPANRSGFSEDESFLIDTFNIRSWSIRPMPRIARGGRGAKPPLPLTTATFRLPSILGLRIGSRLPLHIGSRIGSAAGERDDVIFDVAGTP